MVFCVLKTDWNKNNVNVDQLYDRPSVIYPFLRNNAVVGMVIVVDRGEHFFKIITYVYDVCVVCCCTNVLIWNSILCLVVVCDQTIVMISEVFLRDSNNVIVRFPRITYVFGINSVTKILSYLLDCSILSTFLQHHSSLGVENK